ncbi:MAG TPA: glycosyltransferase family 2 protein [Jatrophihabitans sp.]
MVVTVPAADEQDEIAACLRAIERAIAELHERTTLQARVVVALDDCRDGTAEVVADFPHVQAVTCAARRVGTARRVAAGAALARGGDAHELWLASTDADCRVPPDWLTEMAAAAARGADLVLGTVRPADGLTAGVEQAWYDAHHLGDGHTHIHGANLGIRAGTYVRLGGWRDLPAHEDVDLVERAVAAGVPIARSGAAPVSASIRLIGRAPDGFSAFLQSLQGDPPGLPGDLPAVS